MATTLLTDVQQLRTELADFQGAICKDIRKMFDSHEATVMKLLDSKSDRYMGNKPHISSDTSTSGICSAAATIPAHSNADIVDITDENIVKEHEYANGEVEDIADDEFARQEREWVGHNKINGVFGHLGTMDHFDLIEPVYHVADFYKDEGYAQQIARSDSFDNVTLGVICANAIYLGVDTDRNPASYILDADWGFQVMDHLFCAYFTAELVIRFAAFKKKPNCLRDNWFKFDSFLVILMVAETWIMPIIFSIIGGQMSLPTGPLRLLRLLRLSRLVRLIRQLPELLTMFKGMFVASRAVGSSMLMVLLLLYVFGIVLHMGLSKEEGLEAPFGTLPRCMWTLLLDGTFLCDTGELLTGILERSQFNTFCSVAAFLAFILLSATTVMNMLVGILCEIVSKVAQSERDEAAINGLKETILVELKHFDEDDNGMISKAELEEVMASPRSIAVLQSIEVDKNCLNELTQMLFYSKGPDAEVRIERVMELLLSYRGNLATTVKHLVDAQCFTRWYVCHQMEVYNERVEGYLRYIGDTCRGGDLRPSVCPWPTGKTSLRKSSRVSNDKILPADCIQLPGEMPTVPNSPGKALEDVVS